MARTEGDTWDIVTSVGATALIVSAMRAVEARKAEPLARDDYAQHFVAATKVEATTAGELLKRYNRAPLAGEDELTDAMGQSRYFTAVLGA